jgi:hypothetical protein
VVLICILLKNSCGGTSGREGGEWRRLMWGYMVDGLHILIWNRTMKPLAITLSGVGRGVKRRNDGDDVTNVQHKSNWNCHYKWSLYNIS